MKKRNKKEEIIENVEWFKKFSLEKKFKLAYEQMKAIKILRGLKPKKHATSS
jgi:hypothetical protein